MHQRTSRLVDPPVANVDHALLVFSLERWGRRGGTFCAGGVKRFTICCFSQFFCDLLTRLTSPSTACALFAPAAALYGTASARSQAADAFLGVDGSRGRALHPRAQQVRPGDGDGASGLGGALGPVGVPAPLRLRRHRCGTWEERERERREREREKRELDVRRHTSDKKTIASTVVVQGLFFDFCSLGGHDTLWF